MFAARGTRRTATAAGFGEAGGTAEEFFKLAIEIGLAAGTPFALGWHGASPVLPQNLLKRRGLGRWGNAIPSDRECQGCKYLRGELEMTRLAGRGARAWEACHSLGRR